MLLLLDHRPVARWTPDERARLAVIMAAVLGERVRRLDTATDRVQAAELLLDEIRRAGPTWLRSSASTAHVSAVDGNGLACAITTSAGYGSGVMTPGTGIWLNNCLGEPELNRAGLHGWPPGMRLPSNMAPTVGRHADGSALAIGSPGADRITSALLQALSGLAGGQPIQDAVDAPRIHVRHDDQGRLALDAEEDAVPGLAEALGRAGVAFPVRPMGARSMYFGGVGVVVRDSTGALVAAGDPRREGAVAVV
jgi:gamma-glutamyltranspeptidase/glutathione hydrolase